MKSFFERWPKPPLDISLGAISFARPRPFSTRRITHFCRKHPCRQPMPLRSPWRGLGQGEGEYDCGFHSIFFKGMVAYLPLVLPVSDEVILPFPPTPRRFLRLRICDSAWPFRSKCLSAHRTSQRGAPEEFFVR